MNASFNHFIAFVPFRGSCRSNGTSSRLARFSNLLISARSGIFAFASATRRSVACMKRAQGWLGLLAFLRLRPLSPLLRLTWRNAAGALGLLASVLLLLPTTAHAQGRLRDAEIEHSLRVMSDPIFIAAKLDPSAVNLYLVNNARLNAFVAEGQNIFVHSGLILSTKDVGMLLGALAHETGHIEGGHLARGADAMADAQIGGIAGMILGAAATLAGAKDAGIGVMAASQEMAKRNFLSFSRTQENAADQAALRYLDAQQLPADGMLKLFEIMRQRENRQFGAPDPYSLTHPLTTDRISAVRSHIMQKEDAKDTYPAAYNEMYARMVAKLRGFLESPDMIDRYYDAKDDSVAAQMARAIQAFRRNQWADAKKRIDTLISSYPRDGYLHDLAGQMAYESTQIDQSIRYYEKAVQLLPQEALIAGDFARALMARGQKSDVVQAVNLLERATRQEPDYGLYWDLLTRAYTAQGETGRAALARASLRLLESQPEEAMRALREAEERLPRSGGPLLLRLQDLKRQVEDLRRELKNKS